VELPDVKYARCGDVSIAYLTAGDGPIDLVFTSGYVIAAESFWEHPRPAAFVERLASFSRLIMFDRRGTGLSDPVAPDDPPTLEQWNDDAIAVLDAVGSDRAAVLGWANVGGPASIMFAASHPERTSALVLANTFARAIVGDDYPWGMTEATVARARQRVRQHWGTNEFLTTLPTYDPSIFDPGEADWIIRSYRRGASPATARLVSRIAIETDVRTALSTISVPTLVLQKSDVSRPVERGRHLADNIPGARFIDLGPGPLYVWQDPGEMLDQIQEFLTGAKPVREADRVLATVLFTDIVSSTPRTAELGDRAWRELLDRHDAVARAQIEAHRGRWVKHTGDGALATFDGPARAVRCARAIGEAVGELGIAVRAGLHTGEVELRGEDVTGIAVNIARRVCDLAVPGDVLVSRTVNDLVTGSGLVFEDHGTHQLKGVPGGWQLYAVRP
jgi:class 3 adenylate cyclase